MILSNMKNKNYIHKILSINLDDSIKFAKYLFLSSNNIKSESNSISSHINISFILNELLKNYFLNLEMIILYHLLFHFFFNFC